MNRTCEGCGEGFAAVARQKHCSVLCRFLSKIDYPDDSACWVWIGTLDTHGYGNLRIEGTITLAHRWSFENLGGGVLVAGMVLDHLCRNTACVNPRHLEQVTQRQNIMRGDSPAIITHLTELCQRGHSMADAMVLRNGRRYCRHCANANARARWAAGLRPPSRIKATS